MISRTSSQTKKIAAQLAKKLLSQSYEIVSHRIGNATIVALSGDLGTGKTTFVQGFARALGICRHIVSPTFLLMRSYKISTKTRRVHKPKPKTYNLLYHIDAYRIRDTHELTHIDFHNISKNKNTIILVEWAERIKKFLPKNTIWIQFEHGRNKNERMIKITNF